MKSFLNVNSPVRNFISQANISDNKSISGEDPNLPSMRNRSRATTNNQDDSNTPIEDMHTNIDSGLLDGLMKRLELVCDSLKVCVIIDFLKNFWYYGTRNKLMLLVNPLFIC